MRYNYSIKTSLISPTLSCPPSESTTDVVRGSYGGGAPQEVLYAVFTTPPNAIPGSAVCAFALKDILETFDGAFKQQETMNSNWLPVPQFTVRRNDD